MTTVAKGVIEDLIPVYLSGEASPATKQLVEEYVLAHPEMAPLLRPVDLPGFAGDASPDLGLKALQQTRKLLHQRTSTLAVAAALSASIFTVVFGSSIRFLLFRDAPGVAWLLLAGSLVFYGRFYWICRKLVVTGLGAPHHPVTWGFCAAVASLPFTFLASYQTGWALMRDLSVPAFFAGYALAQSLNKRGARLNPGTEPPRI
jgi:hypothetical protein